MALPQTLSDEKLKQLDDEKLFRYFCKNARYDRQSPDGYQYSIRLGCRSMFSGDTRELFEKFKKKVRSN